jgi:preprotein translocase subunit SecE
MMIKRIKDFFREVVTEYKKVIFPQREELIGSTWVVILTVFMVSVFLGSIDFSLGKLVKYILAR